MQKKSTKRQARKPQHQQRPGNGEEDATNACI